MTGLLALTVWVICSRPKPVVAPAPETAQAPVPELPATPLLPVEKPAALPPPPPDHSRPTNLYARLKDADEPPKLTHEQLEAYLAANHRNAGSLLAAFRNSGDKVYLKEAEERFPNDPRVDYAAAFRSDSPEERSQWLDNLKNSAPDNALANYLAARDDFKAGQTAQALQELTAAAGKQNYQDYSLDFAQNAEEAYLNAGYSEAEAEGVSMSGVLLPQLAELKQVGVSLGELATSYRQAGDDASAQEAVQMALNLAQRLDPGGPGGEFTINNLVGIAVERIALNTMDPAAPFGDAGQTVQDQINALVQQRADIKTVNEQVDAVLPTFSDQDLASYYERIKLFGVQAAQQWVVAKSGQQ